MENSQGIDFFFQLDSILNSVIVIGGIAGADMNKAATDMEKVEGMKISEEERFHVGKRVPLTQQA